MEYIIENDHLDADEIVDEAEQLTIRQDTMLKKNKKVGGGEEDMLGKSIDDILVVMVALLELQLHFVKLDNLD